MRTVQGVESNKEEVAFQMLHSKGVVLDLAQHSLELTRCWRFGSMEDEKNHENHVQGSVVERSLLLEDRIEVLYCHV